MGKFLGHGSFIYFLPNWNIFSRFRVLSKIKPRVLFGRSNTFFEHNGTNFETFPSDLTAAVAFPSNDSKVPYFVYLFRGDKYCYRPINNVTAEDGCPEWRENRELFGCLRPTTQPPVIETTTNPSVNKESVDGSPSDSVDGSPIDSVDGSSIDPVGDNPDSDDAMSNDSENINPND